MASIYGYIRAVQLLSIWYFTVLFVLDTVALSTLGSGKSLVSGPSYIIPSNKIYFLLGRCLLSSAMFIISIIYDYYSLIHVLFTRTDIDLGWVYSKHVILHINLVPGFSYIYL